MKSMEKAFAKVNLFLDVLNRREDGYHDIGTLFQTVGSYDSLYGELDPSGELSLAYNTPQEYPVESDLVYKAVALLKREFCVESGIRLRLDKRLPLGAGLGGGSADCAAALRLANRLWKLGLSYEQLESFGAKLGADVPFLVKGGTALASGIGDVLQPVSDPSWLAKDYAVVLATPLCSVPTKDAYAGIQPSGGDRWVDFQKLDLATVKMFEGFPFFNKFEETVFPVHPAIGSLKKAMKKAGADAVLMSGSGATVFGLCKTFKKTEKIVDAVQDQCRFLEVTHFEPAVNK